MFTTLASLILGSALHLGGITGDLRLGDKYLAEVPLSLKCGTEEVEGKTDKAGSFHLTVKSGGKCQLSVAYDKQTAVVEVVVFDKPVRYRLLLELKDGKYILKRA